MGQEFELKYRADDQKIAAIREKYGDFDTISMVTTYYDTPDASLGQRRWTLRRRLENGKSICTLKTPGEKGARWEWEVECADILSAVPGLCKLGCPEEIAVLVKNGVTEVCGARFTRLAKTLHIEGCTVELALDRGFLTGGGKEIPLAEVEVELKEGSEIAAVAFAKGIATEFALTGEPRSKFSRAFSLANA